MDHHGTIGWNELVTSNVEDAKAFYGRTIGWTYDVMPMPGGEGDYVIAKVGDKGVAGMMPLAMLNDPHIPPHWFTYLMVDDVDKRAAAARSAGATIIRPAFDIPGVGRIVILKDPQGATMGWMTPVPSRVAG